MLIMHVFALRQLSWPRISCELMCLFKVWNGVMQAHLIDKTLWVWVRRIRPSFRSSSVIFDQIILCMLCDNFQKVWYIEYSGQHALSRNYKHGLHPRFSDWVGKLCITPYPVTKSGECDSLDFKLPDSSSPSYTRIPEIKILRFICSLMRSVKEWTWQSVSLSAKGEVKWVTFCLVTSVEVKFLTNQHGSCACMECKQIFDCNVRATVISLQPWDRFFQKVLLMDISKLLTNLFYQC